MPDLPGRTPDGRPLALPGKDVDALRAALRGPVLAPTDPGYDDARSLWNAIIDRRPALVARCLGAADVVAGLRFARERGLALSVKGGGHNISGLALVDGGLLLDLSLQRGVLVDSEARVARAQGGCLLGDVDRETQLHGLAAVLGFVSATGIGGLTLGGGFGYLSRRFGWTSDTVRSMRLVTADGRVVRASEKEHADLFWALRGGGGNFGIVTEIEYALFPVGPEIVGGAVAWPIAEAPAVLDLVRRLSEEAPPELTLVAVLRKAPPAPWIAPSAHGKLIVAVFACDSGPLGEAERRLAPLKGFGSPAGDVLQRRPYVSLQSLLDATQPKGRRYYWKSEYLPRVDEPLARVALAHAERLPSPHGAIVLFQLGGAIGALPGDHSAVGNRDAAAVVNVAGSWESAAEDAANVEWARAAWRDLRAFSTGGTYVNFLTEEETGDRVRAAYGANYARLAVVKAAWDADNVFRANKNVEPARVS